MSFIGEKLLEHARAISRLDRQAVTQRLSGKVAERDFEKRRVRLELGEDPATGKKVLSPWVRVQSQSAGAHKTFVLPSMGEQMTLESEGGRVGANSVARYGTHDDENKHPESEPDEWVHQVGNASFRIMDGRVLAQVDGTTVRLTPSVINLLTGGSEIVMTSGAVLIRSGDVVIQSGSLTHNGKNVGATHTNSGLPVD